MYREYCHVWRIKNAFTCTWHTHFRLPLVTKTDFGLASLWGRSSRLGVGSYSPCQSTYPISICLICFVWSSLGSSHIFSVSLVISFSLLVTVQLSLQFEVSKVPFSIPMEGGSPNYQATRTSPPKSNPNDVDVGSKMGLDEEYRDKITQKTIHVHKQDMVDMWFTSWEVRSMGIDQVLY